MKGPYDNTSTQTHAEAGSDRLIDNLALVSRLARERTEARPRGHSQRDASTARLNAVARIHALLIESPEGPAPKAAAYLNEIIALARASYDPHVRTRIDLALSPELALPAESIGALGLIVHEALANALQYAHPTGIAGEVRIVCQPVGRSGVLLSIEDDGVGLPEYLDPYLDGRTGLNVIRTLVARLGASLIFRSSALGLTVQVLFET